MYFSRKAFRWFLEADESLRARIEPGVDGEPVQYHAPYAKEEFPVYDLSHTSPGGDRELGDGYD